MAFPVTVQREMGYALFLAQAGKRHASMAKTLKGFGGGTVVEVKEVMAAMPIVRSIRCVLPKRYMCFMHSKKSQRLAARRRK